MEQLRSKISELRIANTESRYFVPYQALNKVITESATREALLDCKTAIEHLDELVHHITKGARAVFAILLLIRKAEYTSHFTKNDQFQLNTSPLDNKIPFRRDVLARILPHGTSQEFYEKQWEFAAPVFARTTLPRALETDTILPILKDTPIGEGGFGAVHEILIHASHQRFENSDGQMVCYYL
jgi:hypothetical protein